MKITALGQIQKEINNFFIKQIIDKKIYNNAIKAIS